MSEPLQLSERVTLRYGDVFKIKGGPVYVAEDGTKKRIGEKGLFEYRSHYVKKNRTYINACKLEKGSPAATHTLFVKGKAHRGLVKSIINKPYKVVKPRKVA